MHPPTKMRKYLFKAHAVALQGSIRKPYFQELGQHLAISTYAGSGVHAECTNRDFAVGREISYKSAHTKIDAVAEGNVFRTTLTAQVKGLQVGQRLTVDEVTCQLHSVYDSSTYPGNCLPRISSAGSIIRNLRIDDEEQKLNLPAAFESDQTKLEAFFRGLSHEDTATPPAAIPEPIYLKGFGTVFYAEWTWVHPDEMHQQRLTMLRLALGSGCGAAIDVGVGDSDGYGWPPNVS